MPYYVIPRLFIISLKFAPIFQADDGVFTIHHNAFMTYS